MYFQPKSPRPSATRFRCLLQPQHLPAGLVRRLLMTTGPWLSYPQDMAERLVRELLANRALSLLEKARVLDAMPTLRYSQVLALLETFEDERLQFRALVGREYVQIACLQADALWNAAALVALRCESCSLALVRAWMRRTVRQMAGHGLRGALARFSPGFWLAHASLRWAFGGLYDFGHPAAQA